MVAVFRLSSMTVDLLRMFRIVDLDGRWDSWNLVSAQYARSDSEGLGRGDDCLSLVDCKS